MVNAPQMMEKARQTELSSAEQGATICPSTREREPNNAPINVKIVQEMANPSPLLPAKQSKRKR